MTFEEWWEKNNPFKPEHLEGQGEGGKVVVLAAESIARDTAWKAWSAAFAEALGGKGP